MVQYCSDWEGINNDEILYDSVSLRKIIDEERLCLLVSLFINNKRFSASAEIKF
jgi:hypothetical protein